MDRYALIGSPINHSLSPRIHGLFAEQTAQTLEYTATEVSPSEFFSKINELDTAGFNGLNITVPLKELAWEMADNCDELANRAKAVNTIKFEHDGQRCGFNTDGLGLLQDLTSNHNIKLAGKRILLLGAGGAARGALAPLLNAKPISLTIANRTIDKASLLADEFKDLGSIEGCGFDALSGQQFDLIINGTSTSLSGTVPPLPECLLAEGGITYDMFYAQKPTAFVLWGHAQKASKALDGLGMLVEQAAEAFQIWRGIRPSSKTVIEMLRI